MVKHPIRIDHCTIHMDAKPPDKTIEVQIALAEAVKANAEAILALANNIHPSGIYGIVVGDVTEPRGK